MNVEDEVIAELSQKERLIARLTDDVEEAIGAKEQAESDKKQAESDKKQAESDKKQAESDKKQAEADVNKLITMLKSTGMSDSEIDKHLNS